MLTKDSAVIAETGDAWFNCQKLKLPEGCTYEFQMQYGSIGWAVGATLGYAQAAKDRRVISCIGDGSFQVRHLPLPHSPLHLFLIESRSNITQNVGLCKASVWSLVNTTWRLSLLCTRIFQNRSHMKRAPLFITGALIATCWILPSLY